MFGNVAVTGGIWMFAISPPVRGLTQLLPLHPRCDCARALAILRVRTPDRPAHKAARYKETVTVDG